jgi:hypothetical protein
MGKNHTYLSHRCDLPKSRQYKKGIWSKKESPFFYIENESN